MVPQPPGKVGKDRLAGALGALALDSNYAWVFVDLGTAITINTVFPQTFVTASKVDIHLLNELTHLIAD